MGFGGGGGRLWQGSNNAAITLEGNQSGGETKPCPDRWLPPWMEAGSCRGTDYRSHLELRAAVATIRACSERVALCRPAKPPPPLPLHHQSAVQMFSSRVGLFACEELPVVQSSGAALSPPESFSFPPPPPGTDPAVCFGLGANRSQSCPRLRGGRCQSRQPRTTCGHAALRRAAACKHSFGAAVLCNSRPERRANASAGSVFPMVRAELSSLSRRRFDAPQCCCSSAALPRTGALCSLPPHPGMGRGGRCGAAAAGQSFTSNRGYQRGGCCPGLTAALINGGS